jgi:hypothetical protein
MLAFAKLWTWMGHLFIPFAIGWAVYVRNGLADQPPPLGVLVSRAYWGLLISLVVGSALIWTACLYVRMAKKKYALILVPPNTTFEDENNRNTIISWATAGAFALAILAALAVFGVRYSESQIHKWEDQRPIADSFWGSRTKAYDLGCVAQPCFAVGQRVDKRNEPIFGVNEYILYITDGGLLVFAVLLLAGSACLIWFVFHRHAQNPAGMQDLL